MNDIGEHLNEIKRISAKQGKDPTTRRFLIIMVFVWLATLIALVLVSWNGYFKEKDKSRTLAEQITLACEGGQFSAKDFSKKKQTILCSNAKDVIEGNIGPQGLQGLPGTDGVNGVDGVDGANGPTGKNGRNGANGKNGPPGPAGANGPAGPPGAIGSPGPAGPQGVNGADGKNGTDGKDGVDAIPFTFTFTIDEPDPIPDRTFSCVVREPNSQVTCEEQNT